MPATRRAASRPGAGKSKQQQGARQAGRECVDGTGQSGRANGHCNHLAAPSSERKPPCRRWHKPIGHGCRRKERIMTKDELTAWALANGWRVIAGCPSLTKPSAPKEAIVRMVFKATVVNVEVKKPAGKWEKMSGSAYAKVVADPDTGMPQELGLTSIPGFTMLMRDNKDRLMMERVSRGK